MQTEVKCNYMYISSIKKLAIKEALLGVKTALLGRWGNGGMVKGKILSLRKLLTVTVKF